MLTWSQWVHRRVETIYFESADTYRRRVSVDFTLPLASQNPVLAGDGQEVYFTPLTLLKKRPLTNFDLRDESGAAVPLLTKERNGHLAAALLAGLATLVISSALKERYGTVPPADLEQAFLRLALAEGDGTVDPATELQAGVDMEEASKAWRAELLADREFLAVARTLTLNYLVIVPLCGPVKVRRILKLAYDEPPTPSSAVPRDTPMQRAWRKLVGRIVGEDFGPRARRARRPGWLWRGIGIRSDVRTIEVPAAAYGASYHLEFVAPDGLNITRGVLVRLKGRKVQSIRTLRESRQRAHLYLPSGGDLPLGTGLTAALVHLRPAPATLVRATALLTLFTTALLFFVGLRWESLVQNPSAVPSLLLIVPAGLAALIARPREASITTRLLFGIRLVAIFEGLCAYVAAALLIGGRSCHPTLFGESCESWGSTPGWLFGMAAASLLAACAMFIAWYCSAQPPEQTQPAS